MTSVHETSEFTVPELPVATDRFAAWSRVRERGSVYEMGGHWFITSSSACRQATRTPEVFSSAMHGDTLNAPTPYIPGGIDPPAHLAYRQVIDRRFAPKVLASLEEPLRARFGEIMDRIVDTGRCDIVPDIADIFPAEIFMQLFGLPLGDRERLARWVHTTLVGAYEGNPGGAHEAKEHLSGYLADLFTAKRARPADDFISYILDQGWSDAEVMGTAFNVVQGGLDTMTGALGLIFNYLATHPDLRRQVLADPDCADTAIEEILRLETPVPISNRHTVAESELEGVTIPDKAHVYLCYGAANIDPDVFELPDRVDLRQHRRRDIFIFGGGTHRCLGSHLARKELRMVIEEFHRRIPDYELAPGANPTARWPAVVVSLDSVPLVFPEGGGK